MDIESCINDLYMKILKRRADLRGKKNYSAMYTEYLDSNGKNGLSLSQIEDILYESEEYKNKFKPKPTPREATHDLQGNPLKPQQKPQQPQKPQSQPQPQKPQSQPQQQKPQPQPQPQKQQPQPQKQQPQPQQQQNKKQSHLKIKILNERSKVHIFLLVRDNESTLQTTLDTLSSIEDSVHESYEFYYWILENDSNDSTPSIVFDFLQNKNGRVVSGYLGSKKWSNVKHEQRVKDMAYYRNLNLKMMFLGPSKFDSNIMDINDLVVLENAVNFKNDKWKPYKSKYSIILDTNITFEQNIFKDMEYILEHNNDIGMVTPFGYVKSFPLVYYDTYALQTLENTNKADSSWTKVLDKKEFYEINSGFSGFAMVRTETLKKCKWGFKDKNQSEHSNFCKDVQNMSKKVVIAPGIKVGWTM